TKLFTSRIPASLLSKQVQRTYNKRAAAALLKLRRVQIDDDGLFPYVMIKVYIHGVTRFPRTIIRGKFNSSHKAVYNAARRELGSMELCTNPLGGGYLDVDMDKRKIYIYGGCQTFGIADHAKTQEILMSWTKYKDFQI
ncbi:ocn, partial [Drosophila busckii]